VLQVSLPETTHLCTENKPAERASEPEAARTKLKYCNQLKPTIKPADLTKNGYPGTLTSSHPNKNIIKHQQQS